MKFVHVIGAIDRNFAWDGRHILTQRDFDPGREPPEHLRGAAASVRDSGSECRIVRDPLGLNKLFWVRTADGGIAVAARPRHLLHEGYSLGEVRAIPRGAVVDLRSQQVEPVVRSLIPDGWFSSAPADPHVVSRRIRATIDAYLAALAAAHPSAQAFVCLSGGLDSSGVAALGREHFPALAAVSFDLARPGGRQSDDRLTARRLARELGLPMLEATVTVDELLAQLDTVLFEGIDWRDFNVHAGLVNAALAAAIADAAAGTAGEAPVIVLSGDLANEFLVDYQAERFRGRTYYELPRLRAAALRAGLVRGLDSCHREIGVFGAWDLSAVQPYAAAVDDYLALGEDFLLQPDRKERLCRAVFGRSLPEYVYARPKARAQVGSRDIESSVLAACVDRGIDAESLRRRFARLHGLVDQTGLDRFIRAGRYATSYPSFKVASA